MKQLLLQLLYTIAYAVKDANPKTNDNIELNFKRKNERRACEKLHKVYSDNALQEC